MRDVNALNPVIWPRTAARINNEVVIGGVSASALLAEHGSPLYVYDETDVRERAREYRAAFSDADVFYAGKAFLCTTVAKWVLDEGLGIDVATGGELAVALKAGAPGSRLVLHGNNKGEDEIAQAIDAGVSRIVVDSFEEIERIQRIASGRGKTQEVLIRVTVGVEAHTHEYIATAHEDQKFGLSLATGAALKAAQEIAQSSSLDLVGLHCHIGSQIFDTAAYGLAAHRLVALAVDIRENVGITISELDMGGGIGIAYVDGDDPLSISDFAAQLRSIVRNACKELSFPHLHLSVEPGRAIVGPGGVTLYRVGSVKTVELDGGSSRTYVAVDGGMSDNIRTALYNADYTAVVANRVVPVDAPTVSARIVGKHCESGDIIVNSIDLPADVAAGDIIAVAATGAYCRSMSSQYNHVPRPAVVAVRDGASRVILRRETYDDLLRLEP